MVLSLSAVARATPVQIATGQLEATTENDFIAPSGGCAPLWVELANHGTRQRTVTLRFAPFRSDGQVSRTAALDAGERRTVTLPVPLTLRYGQLELRDEKGELLGQEPISITPREGQPTLLVLGTSSALDALSAGTAVGLQAAAVHLSPKRMPDLLAGYRGFRAVVLLDSIDTLERGQRAALEQYVLTGGTVVFAGTVLEGRMALDTWQGSGRGEEQLGFGTVRRCVTTESCNAILRALSLEPQVPTGSPSRLLAGVGEPPLGAFLVIIIAFALAIGPGNLLLARRRGRHLMLVTIPLFAFTTCAGIAGYGVASDGLFTVHEETRGATFLDDTGKRAATLGGLGLYAALSPSELRFSASTAPLIDTGDLPNVDWSDGLVVRGGFLPSRSYRERNLASVAPSRARLALQGTQVQNALGAPIDVGIARQNGRIVHFAQVPADGAATVSNDADAARETTQQVNAALQGHLETKQIERVIAPLQEGEFLVLLTDDAGFLPTGGLKPQRHRSLHAVRGRIAP